MLVGARTHSLAVKQAKRRADKFKQGGGATAGADADTAATANGSDVGHDSDSDDGMPLQLADEGEYNNLCVPSVLMWVAVPPRGCRALLSTSGGPVWASG